MKDIPLYSTPHGLISVLLSALPVTKTIYIRVLTLNPDQEDELFQCCMDVGKRMDAERIYISGCDGLQKFPGQVDILQMEGKSIPEPCMVCDTLQVSWATAENFRAVMNLGMSRVDCASFLSKADEKWLAMHPDAFFIYDGTKPIGAVLLEDNQLRMMSSMVPGAGERIMNTLMDRRDGEILTLEVASSNYKALRLYQRMGFRLTGVKETWYRMYPSKYFPDVKKKPLTSW